MRKLSLCGAILLLTNCGPGFKPAQAPTLGKNVIATGVPGIVAPNVMPVEVSCGYADEPCVSVKVCNHDTGQCQTIDNVLLDTGSYGLRLFASTIQSLNLPDVPSGTGTLTECTSYLDGSSDWGPVATADVTLGGETTTQPIPIQVIDATYPGIPSTCTHPDSSPSDVQFNGILGVGQFVADCGDSCTTTADNKNYYSCSGGVCTGVTLPLGQQVPNPVAYMPFDNNGVVMILPDLGPGGFAHYASGYLVLGIGTNLNNTPGPNVKVFAAGAKDGSFGTIFEGQTYTDAAFIDSGSNGLFFPQPSNVAMCPDGPSSPTYQLFCPTSSVALTATQVGSDGQTSEVIQFFVDNADFDLASNNPNTVFAGLDGYMPGGFDWGLPFFFGRTIYVGLANDVTTSAPNPFAATGPYWAY